MVPIEQDKAKAAVRLIIISLNFTFKYFNSLIFLKTYSTLWMELDMCIFLQFRMPERQLQNWLNLFSTFDRCCASK